MEQKKINQEHGRKSTKSSSFTDAGEPSRAPRQDEDGRDRVGSSLKSESTYANDSAGQGVSNRPTNEEHAFPAPDVVDDEKTAGDGVEETPKQVGGNRGGV